MAYSFDAFLSALEGNSYTDDPFLKALLSRFADELHKVVEIPRE